MVKLPRWLDEPHEFGLGILILLMSLAVLIGLLTPILWEKATEGPAIPPDLADHRTRGDGLERGESVGATPNKEIPRPQSFFSDRGIKYEWRGSPNWSSRGTNPIQAITVHVTGPGSMAGMAAWFNNPASQVSAHFGIGKNGEVHQYVEVGDVAWHNGIVRNPDLTNPNIKRWVDAGVNPNLRTVGIELLLAGPAEPLTDYPEMEVSLRALLDWLAEETGLALTRDTVIGHYQIDSISRSTDPRCCVDLDSLVEPAPEPPVVPVSACNRHGLRWVPLLSSWLTPGQTLKFWHTSIKHWETITIEPC